MSEAKFNKGDWELDFYDAELEPNHCGVNMGDHRLAAQVVISMTGEPASKELVANAHLIKASPKMYAMLKSVLSEMFMLIDEVNDQRVSRISQLTKTEPDYHSQETLHLIQMLLAEARGEK